MRFSELLGKELIDISEGTRLGSVTGLDLLVDVESGAMVAMVVQQRSGWFALHELHVPWSGIRKIGRDMIVVDISAAQSSKYGSKPAMMTATDVRAGSRRVVRHRVAGIGAESLHGAGDGDGCTDEVETTAPSLMLEPVEPIMPQAAQRLNWRRERRQRGL